MIGIVLAGGNGTRLYPLTSSISKHLLAIYDKPLIYYPISILMMAKIKKILIVCKSEQLDLYQRLLGDGSSLGVEFKYIIQDNPKGIGHALKLCAEYIKGRRVLLALGDNIFHGQGLVDILQKAAHFSKKRAVLFSYNVQTPKDFGIITKSENGDWQQIEEKPKSPKSNQAITGLYFYPPEVLGKLDMLCPSDRGEIEITDLNNLFIKEDKVEVFQLGRGFAWFDAGTPGAMVKASVYMQTLAELQNTKVACLEEISFQNKWISISKLSNIIKSLPNSEYQNYLRTINK